MEEKKNKDKLVFWVSSYIFPEVGSLGQKADPFLPFATVWMDLENIMLSEINQSEKDKYHMISLICGI